MQEAGYREALKCNEEYIDEHKLKVEPCISAGPKTNGRIRKEETGRRSNFTAPAPKVSLPMAFRCSQAGDRKQLLLGRAMLCLRPRTMLQEQCASREQMALQIN